MSSKIFPFVCIFVTPYIYQRKIIHTDIYISLSKICKGLVVHIMAWYHFDNNPDSKVHGANMGPTWVLSAPDGPHVGPMNLAIREVMAWNRGAQIRRKHVIWLHCKMGAKRSHSLVFSATHHTKLGMFWFNEVLLEMHLLTAFISQSFLPYGMQCDRIMFSITFENYFKWPSWMMIIGLASLNISEHDNSYVKILIFVVALQ